MNDVSVRQHVNATQQSPEYDSLKKVSAFGKLSELWGSVAIWLAHPQPPSQSPE